MSLKGLLDEVFALRDALGEGAQPDAARFVRLDAQVREQAGSLSKPDLMRLVTAMEELGEAARAERQETQAELSKLGGDRRAVRGYGCLRSSSQGQRISKKA